MNDIITNEGVLKYLHSRDFTLEIHGEVESTNTLAKDAAKNGAGHFYVIVSDRQSGGRGRLGRSFFSPAGTGLYLSVILRPERADNITMLTSAAAVCMAEAIEECFDVFPEIKWVNDLYIAGKKVCGILTEASFSGEGKPDFAVLGVGVNVLSPDGGFPDSIADIAGSVLPEYIPEARCRLIAAFLDRLYERYDGAFSGAHMDEYRRRCHMVGDTVDVISSKETYTAEILSLNDDCSLTVQCENGKTENIFSGEVSIRRKNG